MKTIIYLQDGSIEETSWADFHAGNGTARYATPEEVASYERGFATADARIEALANGKDRDRLRDVNASLRCNALAAEIDRSRA